MVKITKAEAKAIRKKRPQADIAYTRHSAYLAESRCNARLLYAIRNGIYQEDTNLDKLEENGSKAGHNEEKQRRGK